MEQTEATKYIIDTGLLSNRLKFDSAEGKASLISYCKINMQLTPHKIKILILKSGFIRHIMRISLHFHTIRIKNNGESYTIRSWLQVSGFTFYKSKRLW